jgi:hypothetical protein
MKTLDAPDFYGTTVFCDDIRRELGGKSSYIGIYGAKLFSHRDFPLLLPKFGFGVTYVQKRTAFIAPKKFLIFLPGDEDDAPTIEADFEVGEPQNLSDATINPDYDPKTAVTILGAQFIFSPFEIKKPGNIKVRVDRGGELVRLGVLAIERMPVEPTKD